MCSARIVKSTLTVSKISSEKASKNSEFSAPENGNVESSCELPG